MNDFIGIWKDVVGYEGVYQVSYSGDIRRLYKRVKPKILKPYAKKKSIKGSCGKWLYIKLSDSNGKIKEYAIHRLIARAFLGECPTGFVCRHRNGMAKDNFVSNLEYIDRKELGRITGAASRRKPVVKINRDGEIVECYSSVRECGKANYMSYQTISDRCNFRYIKRSIFAADGFAYSWDEDERVIDRVVKLIREEVAN